MPASTPVYGLPYQTLSDAPDGPDLGQLLAETVETELVRIDGELDATDWTSYVPTWRSGAGGPDVSIVDGTKTGHWTRLPNRLIAVEVNIVRGPGTFVGATFYAFGLPVAPASILSVHGSAMVYQNPAHRSLGLHGFSGSEVIMTDPVGNAVGAVPNGNITAWQSTNRLSFSVVYRAAT